MEKWGSGIWAASVSRPWPQAVTDPDWGAQEGSTPFLRGQLHFYSSLPPAPAWLSFPGQLPPGGLLLAGSRLPLSEPPSHPELDSIPLAF